jgi:hypothetical protein
MKNEGFAVSQKIFCWVVICQNVFSPKAAGWTQPLAFENYENVENHELPRFTISSDQIARHGVHKVGQCVSGHFLSSQFFPNCHLEHFVFLVGTAFSKILSTTHVSYYDYYESKNELIGVASGSFSQK